MNAPWSPRRALTLALFAAAVGATGCKSAPAKQGQPEFEAANNTIDTFSTDVGFGNSPAAVAVAKKFAVRLKKLEADSFTGGKDGEKDTFTRGNFLTYCEMNGNDVVFLVQAPNLDGYEGEVRQTLFQIAWQSAQEASGKPADKNLVVALRGKLLFGAIGKGKATALAPTPEMGTSVEESELYPYFATTPAKS
jgi:hypothetical protein